MGLSTLRPFDQLRVGSRPFDGLRVGSRPFDGLRVGSRQAQGHFDAVIAPAGGLESLDLARDRHSDKPFDKLRAN
jgi:hypothetical protein